MKKNDVIATYKLLNHFEQTEIRLIDPSKQKPPKSVFVNNVDDFLQVCATHEGKYNCYVGINERVANGTAAKDVVASSLIIIDIDPIRSHGINNDPSSENEVQNATTAANSIIKQFHNEKTDIHASIAMSGNGCQLWFKIPRTPIRNDNRDDFELRVKQFTVNIQKQYNSSKINIDQIGDLPRIIKIIGTKSIKGNQTSERPHRESTWLSLTDFSNLTLIEGIMKYDISKKKELDLQNPAELLELFDTEELRILFQGVVEGEKSRSEAEFKLVCSLVKRFFSKEKIFSIMSQSKTGKWNESSEAYKELTYKNALESISDSNKKQGSSPSIINVIQKMQEKIDLLMSEQKEEKTKKPKIEDAYEFILGSIKDGFCDETFQVWVIFMWGQEEVFTEVTSQHFEDFCRLQIIKGMGYIRDNWMSAIVKTIESKYRHNYQRKLYLRSAWFENKIHYQISKTSCVVISKEECNIIRSPYIFRTFQTQTMQNVDLTGTIDDYKLLEKYTNFSTEEEKELFFDILPAFFIPEISKPIILVKGEAGSAKSTLMRIMKRIIDPNINMEEGISLPEEVKEWYVSCRQHYFLFFDNVGKIDSEQQDVCCRIIQGWSFENRKLFTDDKTISGRLKNCMGINGIELDRLQSDFLDRSLIFELKRIPDDKRMGDEQFREQFSQDLPKILGAIFKIIQLALKEYGGVKKIPQTLRLMDFVRYSASVSLARGRNYEDFLKALTDKTSLQKEESIEQSLIAHPLIDFMSDKDTWSGTSNELLDLLIKQEYGKIVNEDGYEKVVVHGVPKHFPQDPRVFGRELTRIGFILQSRGIFVNRKRTMNQRLITIERMKSLGGY